MKKCRREATDIVCSWFRYVSSLLKPWSSMAAGFQSTAVSREIFDPCWTLSSRRSDIVQAETARCTDSWPKLDGSLKIPAKKEHCLTKSWLVRDLLASGWSCGSQWIWLETTGRSMIQAPESTGGQKPNDQLPLLWVRSVCLFGERVQTAYDCGGRQTAPQAPSEFPCKCCAFSLILELFARL